MTEPAPLARRYHGKSVLVTGGTGFIGTHLSRRLVAFGVDLDPLNVDVCLLVGMLLSCVWLGRGGTGEPRDRSLARAEASL